MAELYIGLMSGTSLDGIDAVLVNFEDNSCQIIESYYQTFKSQFKTRLSELSNPEKPVLLKDLGELDCILGQAFAEAATKLIEKSGVEARNIRAIGSHGLTIHHAPTADQPFSLQIGDPNIISQKTGIATVADFRRRDIAAHGQGAPLVPAFHRFLFSRYSEELCIVNIGGIANISSLSPNNILGFDTGPGNTLLDYWIKQNLDKNYDLNGNWALEGSVEQTLLSQLSADPYFQLQPPKSTGKEHFSANWLESHIQKFQHLKAQDIQRTLIQLTVNSIANAIKQYTPLTRKTVLCGGGANNPLLIRLLHEQLNHPVLTTAEYGIDPDYVEAAAFAWLAKQSIEQKPGNLPLATGAEAPVILGGVYPGNST